MSQQITYRIDRHLANLFSLTSTPFDFNEVKGMCLGWGWRLDDEIPENGVAWFFPELDARACLESRKGGGIDGRAYLWFPLDYWLPDEDDPRAGANPGCPDEERREFLVWFDAALGRIRGYVGEQTKLGHVRVPSPEGLAVSVRHLAWRAWLPAAPARRAGHPVRVRPLYLGPVGWGSAWLALAASRRGLLTEIRQ